MGFKEQMSDEEVRKLLYKTMDAVSELSEEILKIDERLKALEKQLDETFSSDGKVNLVKLIDRIETLEERTEEAFSVIDELIEEESEEFLEDEEEK